MLNVTQGSVFDYILEHGSITSFEAFKNLGESRLSARIWELKAKGINIVSEFIPVRNRNKEVRHVKRYTIN